MKRSEIKTKAARENLYRQMSWAMDTLEQVDSRKPGDALTRSVSAYEILKAAASVLSNEQMHEWVVTWEGVETAKMGEGAPLFMAFAERCIIGPAVNRFGLEASCARDLVKNALAYAAEVVRQVSEEELAALHDKYSM